MQNESSLSVTEEEQAQQSTSTSVPADTNIDTPARTIDTPARSTVDRVAMDTQLAAATTAKVKCLLKRRKVASCESIVHALIGKRQFYRLIGFEGEQRNITNSGYTGCIVVGLMIRLLVGLVLE